MTRLATSFVLGYHGCERSKAERALNGEIDPMLSDTDVDWLGPGVYFWESDPKRAQEWALEKASRKAIVQPAVIGAVIDLRNCLDLMARENLDLLKAAHESYVEMLTASGQPVPGNKHGKRGHPDDKAMRYLDCGVIKHLHSITKSGPAGDRKIEPFDTVRGLFTEGDRLYPDSGFYQKTHIQLAVHNTDCIIGLFWPRSLQPPFDSPLP